MQYLRRDIPDLSIQVLRGGNYSVIIGAFTDSSAHSLFFGKAVVVVRREGHGSITLTVDADNLETARMEIGVQ